MGSNIFFWEGRKLSKTKKTKGKKTQLIILKRKRDIQSQRVEKT